MNLPPLVVYEKENFKEDMAPWEGRSTTASVESRPEELIEVLDAFDCFFPGEQNKRFTK